ncbi:hypothetical protein BRC66_06560 [Halobacteriales archaeon QH_2_66_30]|nr:MAG: hypothetical protein BRC66_06560 [Halobacteriales archaeon QH_2_66_30]
MPSPTGTRSSSAVLRFSPVVAGRPAVVGSRVHSATVPLGLGGGRVVADRSVSCVVHSLVDDRLGREDEKADDDGGDGEAEIPQREAGVRVTSTPRITSAANRRPEPRNSTSPTRNSQGEPPSHVASSLMRVCQPRGQAPA